MAKIVSDSLIVSKKNAPLGANVEVETLADIESIQNPAESLIFYVKSEKQHYKVNSFKEVAIAGTSLTKKVIDEYEPMSELGYEEIGDADLDDIFDQENMETMDVADAPAVDFDSLT